MRVDTDNGALPGIPVTMPTVLDYFLMTFLIDSLGSSGYHTSCRQSFFHAILTTTFLFSPGEVQTLVRGGCDFNLSL